MLELGCGTVTGFGRWLSKTRWFLHVFVQKSVCLSIGFASMAVDQFQAASNSARSVADVSRGFCGAGAVSRSSHPVKLYLFMQFSLFSGDLGDAGWHD
jgi:hypothetical protein